MSDEPSLTPPTQYEVLVSVSTALEGLRSSVRALEVVPTRIGALDTKIGALILYIEDDRKRRQEETEHTNRMELAAHAAQIATDDRRSKAIWGVIVTLGTALAGGLSYFFGAK